MSVTHVHVDGHYEPDAVIRISQKKQGTAGNSFLFGQTLVYDHTNDRWNKATSGTGGKYGFCTNQDELTHTTDELTGATTATRGVGENATSCSVLVEGTVEKQAEGAITSGAYVKVGSTNANKVKEWVATGTPDNVNLIVGTYVINNTQHHNANEAIPNAADGDSIKVTIRDVNV